MRRSFGFPRIICQVAAVAAFFLQAAAQTPVSTPTAAAVLSPVPVITFDQKVFDFGKIQFGQTMVHRFKVTNTGNAPLHIKQVKPSCGCTTAVVGKMELEPAESTEIEVAFTPEFPGLAVRKSVLVFSDAPAHPVLSLHFRAEVLPAAIPGKAAQ
jgi:hypothetical protein